MWLGMKKKLFVIPGYLAGIGSLFVLTYSTLLAFFSESKSVTIFVNRFGEQYADIAILIFIWIICLLGLIYLYLLLKGEKAFIGLGGNIRGKKVLNEDGVFLGILRKSFINKKTGGVNKLLIEPSDDIDPSLYQAYGDGNILVSFSSIDFVDNNIVIR